MNHPINSLPVNQNADSSLASRQSGRLDSQTSRILIVEDSRITRYQMRRLLERENFEVMEAKSGEEAVWLTGECQPDLILMDVMMDGMDGYEACRRILAKKEFADIPVIFLTGLSDHSEIVRGFEAGAVDYISKPFHVAEGVSRIRLHLKHRRLLQLQETYIADLETLNKAKDRLLRVASHDLRNPLTAITGLVEFLKEGLQELDPEQEEMLDSVHDASIRMTSLINNLLDLSALESGDVALNRSAVDLNQLVQDTAALYLVRAQQKSITLHWSDAPLPVVAIADRSQIQRVLDNLIANALKFTPTGGQVSVNLGGNDRECRIDVEDTGPGIVAEDASQLFVEFGKTRNQPTGNESCSGLGLNICQQIVQIHQGRIEHKNLPQGGSRFSFTLPAAGRAEV